MTRMIYTLPLLTCERSHIIRVAAGLLAAWRGWGSSMRSQRRLIGRLGSAPAITSRRGAQQSMDDSSHCVIANTRVELAPATRSNRSVVSASSASASMSHRTPPGGGSRSEAWSSIRPGGRPSALQPHSGRVGRAACCPESVHDMSGTVRAQRAPRREVL
jgi:hypothetical protein